MTLDITPRFKPTIDCGCKNPDCGEGIPRPKKNRDGSYHTRSCSCRACGAGQYGKDERKRVRRFANRSGLTQATGSGRHLHFDLSGVAAVEETSAQNIVGPFQRFWRLQAVQDKVELVRNQQRRPWGLALSWGGKVQAVVVEADGFAALCLAACGSDMELALQLVDRMVETSFPPCETGGDE